MLCCLEAAALYWTMGDLIGNMTICLIDITTGFIISFTERSLVLCI